MFGRETFIVCIAEDAMAPRVQIHSGTNGRDPVPQGLSKLPESLQI